MTEQHVLPAASYDLVLRDRRRYRRYALRRRALVRLNSGHIIEVQTQDLSFGGMQICTHLLRAFLLHPSREPVGSSCTPEFDVRVALPLDSRLVEYGARGVVAHTRQPSVERVELGLRFIDVIEPGISILRLFEKHVH